MRIQMTPKTVRRLLSADGYLDLGMPERAIVELEKITDAGPLNGPTELMRGIALKQVGKFTEAVTHLEKAARIMPWPIRGFAWRELVDAYRAVGSMQLAEVAEKLGGSCEFQLKIALPFADMTLDIPSHPKTT